MRFLRSLFAEFVIVFCFEFFLFLNTFVFQLIINLQIDTSELWVTPSSHPFIEKVVWKYMKMASGVTGLVCLVYSRCSPVGFSCDPCALGDLARGGF